MAAHRTLGARKISLPSNLQDTHQQIKQQQQQQQHHHSFLETKRSIKYQYNKLIRERDDLRNQVIKLANYNYAREPDFVRDRVKLRETVDEVGHLKRHVERRIGLLLDKVLDKLEKEEVKLNESASSKFEDSEKFAKSYLDGKLDTKHEHFIDEYTKLRKEAHKASILAEKLTQEKGKLAQDYVAKVTSTSKDVNNNLSADVNNNNSSPVPTPRQKRRVSFNK